jgi:hypothetical protein
VAHPGVRFPSTPRSLAGGRLKIRIPSVQLQPRDGLQDLFGLDEP